jgi:predicted membrane-bound spermidine synthase
VTSESRRIAPLLFFSGLCALSYQIVWLREFRLVFGSSTPASAAVLAVFMGGLGYGSLVLSKRADRVDRPLKLYAHLEGAIAVAAAVTPLLLFAARAVYVAMGGTTVLGLAVGTVVRLLLSAVVLLPATFLMGGTLPAAARAAIGAADASRRTTALLYGVNTLGAVTGAALATFVLLEVFGTDFTLWLACGMNGLVAVAARAIDRSLPETPPAKPAHRPDEEADADRGAESACAGHPRDLQRFVLIAAAVVGFVFLQMELVWYRLLGPLLGGSTYTFGLILAVALLGIGLGGVAYTGRRPSRAVAIDAFAWTCAVEALLIAVPYALGDRVALLALLLRGFGAIGLAGHTIGWTVVASVVVLPAAIVAGYQFPLLIALLGKGRAGVGRHVGLAYAFNTAGAILGSLLGGFVLVPRMGALGAWQLCVVSLLLLAVAAFAVEPHRRRRLAASVGELGGPIGLSAVTLLLLWLPTGPTAFWRHSPIGAGRTDALLSGATRNGLRRTMHQRRRAVSWQVEGIESSIGLATLADHSFLVNGKSDGAAVSDAGTQVMGGLLGALLHPAEVRRALVIGLGSGSTAGWLGQLASIERVDVVELEPAMIEVARRCAPVNAGVLDNPKVHIAVGDAREVLLTTPHRYDVIFSEPSNPYRAGIASLFTQEFYEAVGERLEPEGVFLQFVQAYEIDTASMTTVYATLATQFGSVESWRTKGLDVMLLCRQEDRPVDLVELRRRVATEPYQSALMAAWRATSAEGVLAHYVAQPAFARAVAAEAGAAAVNTDDRNLLEFGIARSLGREGDFRIDDVLAAAARRGERQPLLAPPADGASSDGAELDWARVQDEIMAAGVADENAAWLPRHPPIGEAQRKRHAALEAWTRGRLAQVLRHWGGQEREPVNPIEVMALAEAYAAANDERAEALVERLVDWQPTEAAAVQARLAWARGDVALAAQTLVQALESGRTDPWPNRQLLLRLLQLAPAMAKREPATLPRLLDALAAPLSLSILSYARQGVRFDIARAAPDSSLCVAALEEIGPHVPWERDFLSQRLECYRRSSHPALGAARADLRTFLAHEGQRFGVGLPMPSGRAP